MEAQSLASLNYLAANPPQYPINPTQEKHEPLVLYISRVPGTQDVILSPFKPNVKNVTIQDISSSLYYVHLELSPPPLEFTTPQPIRVDHAKGSSSESLNPTIPRKPLPKGAQPVSQEIIEDKPPSLPARKLLPVETARLSGNHDTVHPVLRPMVDSGLGLDDDPFGPTEPKSLLTPQMISSTTRKPLGPRPMSSHRASLAEEKEKLADERHLDRDLPHLPQDGFEANGQYYLADHNARPRSRSPSASPLRHSPSSLRQPPSPRGYSPSPLRHPPSPIKRFSTTPSTLLSPSFTLTLIRRDPGTGNQWNVGKISVQNQPAEVYAYHKLQSSYPPIDVKIENTGYNKFRNMLSQPSGDDAAAVLQALAGGSREDLQHSRGQEDVVTHGSHLTSPPGPFSRQITMSYAKSWTSALKNKINQKMDNKGFKRRSFVSPPPPAAGNGSESNQGMKPRGYTFLSPWDGRCEFRTGNNGRSVKCHHRLHENDPYNPLVAEQHPERETSHGGGGASNIVSELRFNLPQGDLFTSPNTSETSFSTGNKVRGHFSKLLRQESTDSMWADEQSNSTVSPFDINVGAEKAGGGSRGGRAKLGKLIIYEEGLKMLDLVVAANVGVWWGAWEKAY